MLQNDSTFSTLTSINIPKRIFILLATPVLSFSINVCTQAQEGTQELILLNDIYTAISSSSSINSAPFLYGLPSEYFYQFAQDMGMHNVLIDYYGHIETIDGTGVIDTFYAAHILDATGASIRLAFNSNAQAIDIDFDDTLIRVEPNSAYVALRDFNTDFAIYDFGGDIGLKGETSEISFPYSAFFSAVTVQGLNYVITGENISIENLDVNINGCNYIIGTPGDDTFLLQGSPAIDTLNGGGGEDIISINAISDIDNEETTENNDNASIIGTPSSNTIISNGETILDTGVIHFSDGLVTVIGDITLVGENEFSNEGSSDGTTNIVVEITPVNNNIIVDGETPIPGDVTINDPIISDDLFIIDTEDTAITVGEITYNIPNSTEEELTIDEQENDSFEENENTGGGSFSYLTLFYLAFFGFLQKK